jgi:DNA-binding helix-hairpin-helix protein with protein kinase domain
MILFPKAIVIILLTAFSSVTALQFDKNKNAFKGLYELLKVERDNMITRWDSETKATKFYEKYHALESAKKDYQGLAAYRNSKIKELQSKQREIQLGRYLQGIRIDNARIEGIGPSRTATLQSFGIETAADISERAIRQVPRFGPTFTERLLDWRDAVSRRFVYNANQVLSPRDLTALEKQLLSGLVQLQQLSDDINAKRAQMHKEAIKVFTEFAQADTDFNSL